MNPNHRTAHAIILLIALVSLLSSSCSRFTATPTTTTAATAPPTTIRPVGTHTPQAVPTFTPAPAIDASALTPHLPADATVIAMDQVSPANQGQQLAVALLGYGRSSDGLEYDHIELAVFDVGRPTISSPIWTSGPTLGHRAGALQVRDINGDGVAEVLSLQSTGASGEMLYVLGLASGTPRWLKPSGGKFDGLDYFGEAGVRLEDLDHDGLPEILASYGPAATSTDVYRWDGSRYVFGITLLDK